MRLSEGEELDDALELFHNHSWVEQKPQISAEQMAELIPVLAPLFQRSRSRVRAEKPKQKVARPKTRTSEPDIQSSTIPRAIRQAVLLRDRHECQRCGRSIFGIRYGIQHRRPRQMGGSRRLHTMANLVVLCGWTVDEGTCTEWVEITDRTAAKRDGWLVPNGADPEDWPVRRFGASWEQPGAGWEKTSPHERQIELGALEVA